MEEGISLRCNHFFSQQARNSLAFGDCATPPFSDTLLLAALFRRCPFPSGLFPIHSDPPAMV